ncbi:MAG: hypothetical protein ACD_21C00134G0003 [uncultured bacterium]|nr:MAG: hypothetical protein ACD_21C00134G0003 [uncultured bacterium]HBD05293.1 hypothetical protein [Candidatus Uhrbacteria bacterium]
MKRLIVLAVLALISLPYGAFASTVAPVLVVNALGVINANSALVVDGEYADFWEDNSYITFDFGKLVEGDVTLTLILLEYPTYPIIEFRDEQQNIIHSVGNIFPFLQNVYTITGPEAKYRYVKIKADSKQWKLDGITVNDTSSVQEPVAPITEPEPEPVDLSAGLLLRTQASSTVFLLGSDGKLHPFPSETVFLSWYSDFSDVVTVETEQIAYYRLGKNVTMRSGTWLVKIQTDPKVYAIETGGVLRHVATEAIANELYGFDMPWKDRVVDIDQVFFNDYTTGDPISAAVYPDGSVVQKYTVDPELWYIQNGTRRLIPNSEVNQAYGGVRYAVISDPANVDLYVRGADLDVAGATLLRQPF